MTLLQNFKKQIGQFVAVDTQSGTELMDPLALIQPKSPSSQNPPNSQKKGNPGDPSFKSFEEIYKSSYSHGLEAIYALESIDLKSVRRLEESKPLNATQTLPKKCSSIKFAPVDQFELDFGNAYRGWVDSFVLTEPIQVLRLSPHAEKILLANTKKLIQDLIGLESRDYLPLKGMGQGHIDEIQQKLQEYIGGRDLYHCREINFVALLRSLLGSLDRKKISIALEPFHLAELFTLTSAEAVEARHLSADKREEWLQQIKGEFKSELRLQYLHGSMKKVIEVFVKPWIRQRNGFATQDEIEERIFRMCDDPKIAQNIMKFISTIYCEGQNPFQKHLTCLDEGLYCADEWIPQPYRLVIQKAISYFYKSDLTYSLSHLTAMITREFGLEWISFHEGFIEKTLRYSPIFRVRKGLEGTLQIKLS